MKKTILCAWSRKHQGKLEARLLSLQNVHLKWWIIHVQGSVWKDEHRLNPNIRCFGFSTKDSELNCRGTPPIYKKASRNENSLHFFFFFLLGWGGLRDTNLVIKTSYLEGGVSLSLMQWPERLWSQIKTKKFVIFNILF